MPNGGTLSIAAENLFIDENYARMYLDDSCIHTLLFCHGYWNWISPEIVNKIFEPFFRPGPRHGAWPSTVIGILKSHGGFVNVYSEVGKGTKFKVYLPAVEAMKRWKSKTSNLWGTKN